MRDDDKQITKLKIKNNSFYCDDTVFNCLWFFVLF